MLELVASRQSVECPFFRIVKTQPKKVSKQSDLIGFALSWRRKLHDLHRFLPFI